MSQESSSNLIENWNSTVKSYLLSLGNYRKVLATKLSKVEQEMHLLVDNTSIKLTERKSLTFELMEDQEKIKQIIDDLDQILLNKGDSL